MPRLTGKNLVVQWIYSGGTVVASTSNAPYRSFSPSDTMNTADVTGGNDAATISKPTTRVLKADFEFVGMGADGTVLLNAMKSGNEGTINWGEDGTATGKPKGGFPAVVTERSPSLNYDGEITWAVSFTGQGDYTSDPAVATW